MDPIVRGLEAKQIGMLIYPTPETPDDTRIEDIRFPTRVRNALAEIGLKTVDEIRESSDVGLRKYPKSRARLGCLSSAIVGDAKGS